MSNKYTISVFAIAIFVVIAGLFLLDIPKIELYNWAFAALLFSMLLSLGSILTINNVKRNKDSIFYGASLSTTVFIYLVAVIISIFFIKNFEYNVKGFIFLQLTINALFLITLVIIVVSAKFIYQRTVIESEKLQNGEYRKPKRGGL